MKKYNISLFIVSLLFLISCNQEKKVLHSLAEYCEGDIIYLADIFNFDWQEVYIYPLGDTKNIAFTDEVIDRKNWLEETLFFLNNKEVVQVVKLSNIISDAKRSTITFYDYSKTVEIDYLYFFRSEALFKLAEKNDNNGTVQYNLTPFN